MRPLELRSLPSSARLLSAHASASRQPSKYSEGSGFLDAAHIWAPRRWEPEKGWQRLSALRGAEGFQNSVKGSRKQRPKSHFGCGACLSPPAPGAQKGWQV